MKTSVTGLFHAPLHVFEQLPSSNSWLLDQGNACAHGETVRVLRQTRGRGRNGRSWMCREGAGLTFSCAFRVCQCRLQPEYQGAVAALALAVFLERRGLNPRLKWPNDVLVDDRKIAGILGESNSDVPDIVVVGIGCNIRQTPQEFAVAGLNGRAVSLAMRTGRRYDLDSLFADVLKTWQQTIEDTNARGLPYLVNGWRQRDALRDREIVLEDGGRRIQGTSLGVDPHFGLTIRDAQGQLVTMRGGEITHIGRLI